jgi:hypothetical protein
MTDQILTQFRNKKAKSLTQSKGRGSQEVTWSPSFISGLQQKIKVNNMYWENIPYHVIHASFLSGNLI